MGKCKEIFLADPFFTERDHGLDATLLCAVRVSRQCYNALKARDYVMNQDELRKFMTSLCIYDTTRAKIFGGSEGFQTLKEVLKVAPDLATATEVRALAEKFK